MSSSARAATSGEDGHDATSASHPAVTVTASASAAPGRGLAGGRGPGEHQPRAGVAEVVLDLAGLEQRVHRHHHAAGPEHPVVQHRESENVRQHDAHPVAGPEPPLPQPAGHLGRPAVQFGIGQDLVVEAHGWAVRVLSSGIREVDGQVGH